MNQINNYEEISSLISLQIKRGTLTNNFLSEDDLKLEIQNKNLYYFAWNGGLLIFRDRRTHYILNYYINDINEKLQFDFDKDVVVEIVLRANDEKAKEALDFFESKGMKEYLRRIRLIKSEEISIPIINKIEICKEIDYEEISEILRENFDKYSGCIPTKEALLKDIKNENIYVYKNEKVEGVLRVSKNNMSSEIKHLVVKEEARRKKIAQSLVLKYFEDVNAKRKTVWTGLENKIAINFYEKMGYKIDKYNSIVLIKREEI